MTGLDYYDRECNPIEMLDWAKKIGDHSYKVVKQEDVNGYRVSTVWLGLDHSFGMFGGPPIIFETMVFGKGDQDGYQERYATEEQALAGHKLVVEMVKVNL